MRILHIVAGVPPGGGIAESVPTLCRHLRKLGHEVTLATLDGPLSDAALAAEAAGVRLVRFDPSFPYALYFSWSMLRNLSTLAREADVVHVHSNWTFPVWWGCRCALRAHKPLVMSPRGCLDPVRLHHSAWKKRLVGWLDRSFLTKAAVIHVTAECERDWVRAYLGTCGAEIAVIPNGIELEPRNTRKTRNCEEGKARTLLYLGRLHPLKGLDLLVEAWARVKGSVSSKPLSVSSKPLSVSGKPIKVSGKSGNVCGRTEVPEETDYDLRLTVNGASWQLIIAGPDEQGTLKALKAQAERLGLTVSRQLLTVNCEPAADGSRASDPDIRLTACRSPFTDLVFMGPVYGERKALLLSQADLFVLPTRSDNFGIAVAEALASGVPVVCTKGAPWEELLGNEEMVSGKRLAVSGKPFSDDGENVSGKRLTVNSKSLTVSGGQCSETERIQPLTADGLPFTDFTSNGRCGWWVDIGAEPLAAALREAMSLTDEERRAMGANGRRLVERKYRWETVAERMGAVYRGIVNGKP